MKTTQDVRKYAAKQGIAEEEAGQVEVTGRKMRQEYARLMNYLPGLGLASQQRW